ncbi:MAG: helix-turn-helix domain-containing protein [Treponema sp.]|nr:helix-turn-helix domain-containing protein [Treponema sp.]
MSESLDLRAILAQNIKNARGVLGLTQAKLAQYADISLSSVIDIERCRTWVSDKTLLNLARALNREAYELLIPPDKPDTETRETVQIAALIKAKQAALKQSIDAGMNELLQDILRGGV